jgi:phospholipid/cholesterol/gamma-HCH transport system permease protein
MLGGWIIAVFAAAGRLVLYWQSVVEGLYIEDVWMGIIKPFFLGLIIVTIGCHVGLRTSGGTQGVGRSTTKRRGGRLGDVLAVDFFVTRLLISVLF